jgi:hypothetical protein
MSDKEEKQVTLIDKPKEGETLVPLTNKKPQNIVIGPSVPLFPQSESSEPPPPPDAPPPQPEPPKK